MRGCDFLEQGRYGCGDSITTSAKPSGECFNCADETFAIASADCAPGTLCSGRGRTSCEDCREHVCRPGEYLDGCGGASAGVCSPCPLHTYAGSTGLFLSSVRFPAPGPALTCQCTQKKLNRRRLSNGVPPLRLSRPVRRGSGAAGLWAREPGSVHHVSGKQFFHVEWVQGGPAV